MYFFQSVSHQNLCYIIELFQNQNGKFDALEKRLYCVMQSGRQCD